jgi:hypothetical protein
MFTSVNITNKKFQAAVSGIILQNQNIVIYGSCGKCFTFLHIPPFLLGIASKNVITPEI